MNSIIFTGKWNSFEEGQTPVPDGEPLLLVTCETVLRTLGYPSFAINIGHYDAVKEQFSLDDDVLIKGIVLFWAKLPELPHEAIAAWEYKGDK